MKKPAQTKVIVFDFDGVISNSEATAFEILHTADPAFTREEWHKRFEGNVHDTKPNLLAREDFYKQYSPIAVDQPIFEGIADAVVTLAKTFTLTINSSGATELITQFLQKHTLDQHFPIILGFEASTSKVAKLKQTFVELEVTADDCIMVTDTLGDIREATKANVRSIAVTWGFHDIATLRKGNPVAVATGPEQLPELVASLL